ncbi:uncharacterized protein EI90DRAFT_3011555 [Cantharellus anzutake]|uniref:uncharacterized protein n=1 Tax=Cantharellus anzutake TaxID=1750568 RepID=UPI0019037940|nr:uncharacterized protein EI90DRAFT_3011555 [Cantharellus anzutake]KAF8343195.1 hypothetical protein EI90DRAFT_3011555 [Cantharellus anzutake]
MAHSPGVIHCSHNPSCYLVKLKSMGRPERLVTPSRNLPRWFPIGLLWQPPESTSSDESRRSDVTSPSSMTRYTSLARHVVNSTLSLVQLHSCHAIEPAPSLAQSVPWVTILHCTPESPDPLTDDPSSVMQLDGPTLLSVCWAIWQLTPVTLVGWEAVSAGSPQALNKVFHCEVIMSNPQLGGTQIMMLMWSRHDTDAKGGHFPITSSIDGWIRELLSPLVSGGPSIGLSVSPDEPSGRSLASSKRVSILTRDRLLRGRRIKQGPSGCSYILHSRTWVFAPSVSLSPDQLTNRDESHPFIMPSGQADPFIYSCRPIDCFYALPSRDSALAVVAPLDESTSSYNWLDLPTIPACQLPEPAYLHGLCCSPVAHLPMSASQRESLVDNPTSLNHVVLTSWGTVSTCQAITCSVSRGVQAHYKTLSYKVNVSNSQLEGTQVMTPMSRNPAADAKGNCSPIISPFDGGTQVLMSSPIWSDPWVNPPHHPCEPEHARELHHSVVAGQPVVPSCSTFEPACLHTLCHLVAAYTPTHLAIEPISLHDWLDFPAVPVEGQSIVLTGNPVLNKGHSRKTYTFSLQLDGTRIGYKIGNFHWSATRNPEGTTKMSMWLGCDPNIKGGHLPITLPTGGLNRELASSSNQSNHPAAPLHLSFVLACCGPMRQRTTRSVGTDEYCIYPGHRSIQVEGRPILIKVLALNENPSCGTYAVNPHPGGTQIMTLTRLYSTSYINGGHLSITSSVDSRDLSLQLDPLVDSSGHPIKLAHLRVSCHSEMDRPATLPSGSLKPECSCPPRLTVMSGRLIKMDHIRLSCQAVELTSSSTHAGSLTVPAHPFLESASLRSSHHSVATVVPAFRLHGPACLHGLCCSPLVHLQISVHSTRRMRQVFGSASPHVHSDPPTETGHHLLELARSCGPPTACTPLAMRPVSSAQHAIKSPLQDQSDLSVVHVCRPLESAGNSICRAFELLYLFDPSDTLTVPAQHLSEQAHSPAWTQSEPQPSHMEPLQARLSRSCLGPPKWMYAIALCLKTADTMQALSWHHPREMLYLPDMVYLTSKISLWSSNAAHPPAKSRCLEISRAKPKVIPTAIWVLIQTAATIRYSLGPTKDKPRKSFYVPLLVSGRPEPDELRAARSCANSRPRTSIGHHKIGNGSILIQVVSFPTSRLSATLHCRTSASPGRETVALTQPRCSQ